jgi:hypothetical protein
MYAFWSSVPLRLSRLEIVNLEFEVLGSEMVGRYIASHEPFKADLEFLVQLIQ